jgi:WD40 repeat protein
MLLSTKNGGRKGTIKTEQNWVRAMVFASTGNSLTTVGERPVMKKWNTREGLSLKLQREWTVHADQVWSVAYSHDRQSLATSSSDGTVKLWSDDGRYDFSVGITRTKHEILRQRRGVTADGRRIVFAAANILEVWDIPKRRRLQSLGGTGPNFGDFSCSTDANNIITCGPGRPVEIWNVRTKVVEHVLPEWANNAESVVLHPNGADAIVSAPGLPIRVWSRTQQRTIAEYPLHTASYAQRLKISPDGRVLAAIESPSNEVVFWDLSTGNETRPRRCADGSDLVFSPDGNRLAYVAADWTARI